MKKLNDRQRLFCEHVAKGTPAGRAYEEAGYSQRGDSADQRACKLLKEPHIAAHLEQLRNESATAAGMSRDELITDLVTILRSPPSAASMDNPLCELAMSKAGPFAKFPDKSRAAERLVRLLGWDKPVKVEGVLTLSRVLQEIHPSGLPGDEPPDDD